MSTFIGCGCSRYDRTCSLCRAGRAAYRAGWRAYKRGRSRHERPDNGFGYRWSDGWEDARNVNPNTAARRAKERAILRRQERTRLVRERTVLDKRIKALTP